MFIQISHFKNNVSGADTGLLPGGVGAFFERSFAVLSSELANLNYILVHFKTHFRPCISLEVALSDFLNSDVECRPFSAQGMASGVATHP